MKTKAYVILFSGIFMSSTLLNAAIAVSDWSIVSGLPVVINGSRQNPIIGDGTVDSASSRAIGADFTSSTLTSTGGILRLTGTVEFIGGITTIISNQFRWGLYNVNASPDMNGWLGYFATSSQNPTTSIAGLHEKSNPNTTNPVTLTSGAALISPVVFATGTNTAFLADTGHVYDFSLSYIRYAGSDNLTIDWSLNRQDGTYLMSSSFTDTSVETYTFNRVALLSGGSLQADQVNFNNVDVTLSPIPEPSVALLGGLGVLALLRRRR